MSAPQLYKEIILHFTKDSHTKMEAIAQHSTYKHYIHGLHIVPKAISGPRLNCNEFADWLRGDRSLDRSPRGQVWYFNRYHPSPRLVISNSIESSTEVLKSHSHQYLTRYTKLEQLFGSAGQSLGDAVVQFSRLKRIGPGSLWHWNRKREEYAPGDKGIILEECTESSCQIKLDSDQATMVLKAIARGASLSGAKVGVGHLFEDIDISVMNSLVLEDRERLLQRLAHVKSFNCPLEGTDPEALTDMILIGRLKTYVKAMTNIDTLTFQYLGIENLPISLLCGGVTWQHLTTLILQDVRVDLGDLADILERHRNTFQGLSLYDLEASASNWHNVFADLHNSLSKSSVCAHTANSLKRS